jgi:hypothetical protein
VLLDLEIPHEIQLSIEIPVDQVLLLLTAQLDLRALRQELLQALPGASQT